MLRGNLNVLKEFPVCRWSFAYGSSIFSQGERSDKSTDKLVDFIVAVDDPVKWHRSNMERNSHHYNFMLRWMGPERVAKFQRTWGSHMIFFPYVKVQSLNCKYGVVATDDLIRDLTTWDVMYCSGRLHKPVMFLSEPDDKLKDALQLNLRHALHAALIMCRADSVVKEVDLFAKITSISYTGDVRVEEPAKVTNIVTNNFEKFQKLYEPVILELIEEQLIERNTNREIVVRQSAKKLLSSRLPKRFVKKSPKLLKNTLYYIVQKSSFGQTWKGIVSAGLINAFIYAKRKVAKRLRLP